jgi:hypothetical protein
MQPIIISETTSEVGTHKISGGEGCMKNLLGPEG